MNLHVLRGIGLPNIYLHGGINVKTIGNTEAVSYANLDGLYAEIARTIALCSGPMTALELRFLRKRLGMSQGDVAALGGKTEQAAAKWEKGTLPVPQAEASLLRIKTLAKYGKKRDIVTAVSQFAEDAAATECSFLVFCFDGAKWAVNRQMSWEYANQQAVPEAFKAIASAVTSSQLFVTNSLRDQETATTV